MRECGGSEQERLIAINSNLSVFVFTLKSWLKTSGSLFPVATFSAVLLKNNNVIYILPLQLPSFFLMKLNTQDSFGIENTYFIVCSRLSKM